MTDAVRPSDRRIPVVHLHIGTMKSGTSYVQGMLARHRDQLRQDGVLFPGATWAVQVEAVRDLLGVSSRQPSIRAGSWDAMVAEIAQWTGTRSIVSMEMLSTADSARVERVVSSFDGSEVHAIITVRDLARVIPSAWQESTQNRQTWTWPDYIAALTGEPDVEPLAQRRFWKQHDVAAIAERWAEALGPERVHIVVVPPSGGPRDLLWQRFCSVVGLDPERYIAPPNVRGNPAVGAASAELLRRLNVQVVGAIDLETYDRVVKRYLAKQTLSRRTGEYRLTLPTRYRSWAVERSTNLVRDIQKLGIDVVGNLEELIPDEDAGADDVDVTADAAAVTDAAVHALSALVLELARVDQGGGGRGARGPGGNQGRRRQGGGRGGRAGSGHVPDPRRTDS